MALKSGFFTSVGGDRAYSTADFEKIFNSLITDGVFANHGDLFVVGAGTGMSVTVGSGYAWFDSKWTHNEETLIVNLEGANLSNDRIDAIVLETHAELGVRENRITYKKGTPAVSPQRPTMDSNQHALAYVRIPTAAPQILAQNITNVVGTSETPFITGILETADISVLLNTWNSQAEAWLTDFESESGTAFENWFNALEDDLISGQAATRIEARLLTVQDVVNEIGKEKSFTLTAAGFNSQSIQNVSLAGLDSTVRAILEYAPTATMAQRAAFNQACLMVTSVSANSFTVRAFGIRPTIDIPCVLQVIKEDSNQLV